MNYAKADISIEVHSNTSGEKLVMQWHDLVGRGIPQYKWKQVHIIANYNGKVVLVYFDKTKLFNLPGGHIEAGEDIEATMRRELAEETGGRIAEWEPIGYQVRIDSDGNTVYQLRVYAKVINIQNTSVDYDGSIVPVKLVDIDEMTKELGWENPIGSHIFNLVKSKFVESDVLNE